MTDATNRRWLERLADFLHRHARPAGGRTLPPAEFGDDLVWDAVYRRFYPALGGGRTYKAYKAAVQLAGHVRRTGAAGAPPGWSELSRVDQWSELAALLDAEPDALAAPASVQT